MRVVLDTNVVLSGLLWDGNPERLLDAAGNGSLQLVTSEALIDELARVLTRAKFAAKLEEKNLSVVEIVARYRELAEIIEPASIDEARLRDPDDLALLACAVAAKVVAVVSGDDDVRDLGGNYQGILVLSPMECLGRLSA